jgi:hypothetical protein
MHKGRATLMKRPYMLWFGGQLVGTGAADAAVCFTKCIKGGTPGISQCPTFILDPGRSVAGAFETGIFQKRNCFTDMQRPRFVLRMQISHELNSLESVTAMEITQLR